MNPVARVIDKIVNLPRVSDPDRLRAAVSGKTVLVTGASYGLGEATTRKLGAAGANVLLVARSAERLAALEASINAGGGHAVAYPTDLTDLTAVAALAKTLTENHGPMDVVVSNAGKSIRRSLHLQYDRPQDFDRTIGVNYLGPVRLLLGLLPAMRKRGSGHIVSISTIGVRTAPGPRWGTYLASKSAFDVWLRSVEPELRADGVDVTSVYMTLVHTPMSDPTPILRRMPGLSAQQAADIVAKAIIDRPGRVQPWWVWPMEIGTILLPGPLEVGMGLMYRFSTDSPSARGMQQ